MHWNNATHRGRVLNRIGAGIDIIEKIGELQYIDTKCFIKAKVDLHSSVVQSQLNNNSNIIQDIGWKESES